MATNYTNLLGFALPTTGELAGTWGQVVNDSITELVEDSIAGTASVNVTSGNVTLTTTGSGAANEARCAIILVTGTPGTARQVIAPSQSKAYIVINQSDSNITFKGAATTGHLLRPGDANLLAWDGSDYIDIEQGDVTGPAGATDNAVVRFDGTTGKLIQNSVVTIADTTGDITTGGTVSATVIDTVTTETTYIDAKDGTLSATIADSTGIFTHNTVAVFQSGTAAAPSITFTGDTNNGIYAPAADTIGFATSGAEAVRINSSGQVGIGTNNPANPLAVISNTTSQVTIEAISGNTNAVLNFTPQGTGVAYIKNAQNTALAFGTNNTERMKITAAGFTQPTAYADTVVALGNTGTAINVNMQAGNVFTATLTGNCTFTLQNPIATGSSSFTLILTNDGTAGRTVAWSGGTFLFPGGAASLSRTTTANATDIWAFFTPNGGTTWYGNIVMKDVKA
jgi:hypothetical protein